MRMSFWDGIAIDEARAGRTAAQCALKVSESEVALVATQRDLARAERKASDVVSRSLIEEIKKALETGDLNRLRGLEDPKSPLIVNMYKQVFEEECASLGLRM